MRPDIKQLTLVSYEVVFPPLRRFKGNELAEFYALLHGLHPLESCVHHGEFGGTIETEGWVTIEISRESITYQERTREDFSVAKKRATDVFDLARTHFEVPFYAVSEVKLRQVWPAPAEGDMAQRLRKALGVAAEHYEHLGDNVGAGIHLFGNDDSHDMHWDLELDPNLREATSLWVQLKAHFHEPGETIDALADGLQHVSEFLEDNVTKFVQGILG